MNPTQLESLAFRLQTLTVFRSVLSDPVIASLMEALSQAARLTVHFRTATLGAEQQGQAGASCDGALKSPLDAELQLASAYARFVSTLLESGSQSLAGHVLQVVVDDENVYLRRLGAGDEVPPTLTAAVEHELSCLQELAALSPDELLSVLPKDMRSALPAFETGTADIVATYHKRVSHIGQLGYGMYARHAVFRVDKAGHIVPVHYPDPQRLSDLVDYDRERSIILENTKALLAGRPAANILLTGDAGTGKSSTIKAVANELAPQGLRILEVRKEQLIDIPAILDELTSNPLKFIIFIDDLSFAADDDDFAALKAILEGSVSAKSDNVVIYATSNRRHLVRETFSQREGDDVHLNDTLQEIMSLSDRFGIHVTFSRPNKATYLDIVHKLAAEAGVDDNDGSIDAEAERFALRRGGRSARGARQFVDALVTRRDQRKVQQQEGSAS